MKLSLQWPHHCMTPFCSWRHFAPDVMETCDTTQHAVPFRMSSPPYLKSDSEWVVTWELTRGCHGIYLVRTCWEVPVEVSLKSWCVTQYGYLRVFLDLLIAKCSSQAVLRFLCLRLLCLRLLCLTLLYSATIIKHYVSYVFLCDRPYPQVGLWPHVTPSH